MELLAAISAGWSRKGLHPAAVVDVNPFGNVIVRDRHGVIWRIIPEELQLVRMAETTVDLAAVLADPEFQEDWLMTRLVERARKRVGPLELGCCYTLKMPAVLGGAYDDDANLGSASLEDLMRASGRLAYNIEDVPDGTPVLLTDYIG